MIDLILKLNQSDDNNKQNLLLASISLLYYTALIASLNEKFPKSYNIVQLQAGNHIYKRAIRGQLLKL